MLIAPRISNHVGEQIAHTTIEDFKALKSKATSDEPTEKKESSEDSVSIPNPAADSSKSNHDPDWQIKNEEGCIKNGELPDSVINVDFDRLYSDSIAYNENLKKHQHELLVSEQSYLKPSLDLRSYGITRVFFCSNRLTVTVGFRKLIHQIQTLLIRKQTVGRSGNRIAAAFFGFPDFDFALTFVVHLDGNSLITA